MLTLILGGIRRNIVHILVVNFVSSNKLFEMGMSFYSTVLLFICIKLSLRPKHYCDNDDDLDQSILNS